MFLTQDEHVLYVETEEEFEKPKFKFSGEAKEALRNYYDSVHELCTAQTNFAKVTQEKLKIKLFLKYHPAGTATSRTNTSQNGGRN